MTKKRDASKSRRRIQTCLKIVMAKHGIAGKFLGTKARTIDVAL